MTLWPHARRRAVAFFFDYFLIAGYLGVLAAVYVALPSVAAVFADRLSAQVAGFLLVTLPVTLYFALSESSRTQASWGKSRTAMKVTDGTGQRITFGRCLARTILKFVPWEISHTLVWETTFNPALNPAVLNGMIVSIYVILGANVLSVALTRTRQTLYDLACGTRVSAA